MEHQDNVRPQTAPGSPDSKGSPTNKESQLDAYGTGVYSPTTTPALPFGSQVDVIFLLYKEIQHNSYVNLSNVCPHCWTISPLKADTVPA